MELLLKEIRDQLNESTILTKEMVSKLTEILDTTERRWESNYFNIGMIAEKLHGLEEYMGIEWQDKGLRIRAGYTKRVEGA